MSKFILIAQVILTLLWTSCARKKVHNATDAMRAFDSSHFKLTDDLDLKDFLHGLRKHINILKIHTQKLLRFGQKEISHQDYADALAKILEFSKKEELLAFINKNFDLHEV